MNNANVRKEMKYIINKSIYEDIVSYMGAYIKKSDYFLQRIHNVYYDNDYYGVISRSKSNSDFKEKLRVRAYESDKGFSKEAFIELKKKYKGITYKRRIKVTTKDVNEMLDDNKLFPDLIDNQIKHEVLHFQNKTKCYPKVYLSYQRISYICSDGSDMRITFDSDIYTRESNLNLKLDKNDILFATTDLVIMEVKVNGSMPMWFIETLNKFNMCPTSYSKYAKIIASDILELEDAEVERGNRYV